MRYVGILLVILSIVIFSIMYNFSNTMLDIIDTGQIGSCQTFDMCPHVSVLNQTYLGYVLALVIFIIGILMTIFGGITITKGAVKKNWDDVVKTLKGDEKDVYEKITASDGMIFQSDLVEQSGFPKARVSRILDKMEGKGLLERKRRGMANAIVLK